MVNPVVSGPAVVDPATVLKSSVDQVAVVGDPFPNHQSSGIVTGAARLGAVAGETAAPLS